MNNSLKSYSHIFPSLIALFLSLLVFVFIDVEYHKIVKAFHIIFAISWMAGMLYLPRLFVYHTKCGNDSLEAKTFKIMEIKLLKNIMNPSMILTWGLGLWLAWKEFFFQGGWLHMKISLVLFLSGLHAYLQLSCKRFSRNKNQKSETFWRILNEVPALIMVLIIFLVVLKPF